MNISSEKSFKRWLLNSMNVVWDVQCHEDKHSVGIPDLSYAMNGRDGWIELKYMDRWPGKRKPVTISNFTEVQKSWLKKRGKYGSGLCFMLLYVKEDRSVTLIKYSSLSVLGHPKDEFIFNSEFHSGIDSMDWGRFIHFLGKDKI